MTKQIIIILSIFLIAIGVFIVFRSQEPEFEAGDCRNFKDEIIITSPLPGQVIDSPLVLKGEVRGNWMFEANLPVQLEDENGNVIQQWYAMAKSDWMTENFVPFEGELEFLSLEAGLGKMIFAKDNPSGLPENDKFCFVPVQLPAMETMSVKVFFANDQLDPEITCEQVFSAERTVEKTTAVARVALEELFKGPSQEEQSSGYGTTIPGGVEIQSLVIEEGIAKVDFNDAL